MWRETLLSMGVAKARLEKQPVSVSRLMDYENVKLDFSGTLAYILPEGVISMFPHHKDFLISL